jgi:hypothetical protein
MNTGDEFTTGLDRVVEEMGMGVDDDGADRRGPVRGSGRGADGETLPLRFVERDGVLILDDGSLPPPPGERRGRRGREETVWETDLARLEPNQVGKWISALDDRLTPDRGLRRYRDGAYEAADVRGASGRALLVVHGTFSHTRSVLGQIESHDAGGAFLEWAHRRYDRILTFDHPTLAVSPALNAHALERVLRGYGGDLDVVCHSRGGLVTRWWLEAFDRGPGMRRVVFVGCPLAGTGLAAPPNLRGSLSLLGNFARALGAAGAGVPFLTFVSGIFRLVGSVTKLASKTPAIDAAVALVPGLNAQQRVGNNAELLSMRGRIPADLEGRYFAVRSDFEPEAVGWRFWRYFRKDTAVNAAKDLGTDLVFDGANDLVVDSGSMVELAEGIRIPESQVLDFGSSTEVHHTSYFANPRTLEFVREAFAAPPPAV